MKSYIAKFRVPVSLSLNEEQRAEVRQLINLMWLGESSFPSLDVRAEPEHVEAHWKICGCLRTEVEIGVLPDGTFEVTHR